MDYQPYAKKLEGALTPETQRAFLAVMDPVAWAAESHKLAEKDAYRDAKGNPIKSGDSLGDDYANKNSPVIGEQLTKARLRLALMLNGIYDPGGGDAGVRCRSARRVRSARTDPAEERAGAEMMIAPGSTGSPRRRRSGNTESRSH